MRRTFKLLFMGSLVALFLGATPSLGFARQDEGWIDSFTVDGQPPYQARLEPGLPDLRQTLPTRGWIATVAAALKAIPPWRHTSAVSSESSRAMVRRLPLTGTSPVRRISTSVGVLPAGSTLGTTELRCAGGARSGNPDADITIWIGIAVAGTTVASNQATGYMPNTVAATTIANVGYDRPLECALYAGGAYAQATGTILADCGDNRTYLRAEYFLYQTESKPACNDFTSSVPGLSHYSFENWRAPDWPWALLQVSVTSNTYCVVSNHGSTPGFSSGYRNPVHNANVGGATNSRHIYGDAVDLQTPTSPDDTLYNSLRWNAKNGNCSVACVEPRDISPAHYHGDYRGGCPTGW